MQNAREEFDFFYLKSAFFGSSGSMIFAIKAEVSHAKLFNRLFKQLALRAIIYVKVFSKLKYLPKKFFACLNLPRNLFNTLIISRHFSKRTKTPASFFLFRQQYARQEKKFK